MKIIKWIFILLGLFATSGYAAYSGYIVGVSPSSFSGGYASEVTIRVRNTGDSKDMLILCDAPENWTVTYNGPDANINGDCNPIIPFGDYYDAEFTVTPPLNGGYGTIIWELRDDGLFSNTLLNTNYQSVTASSSARVSYGNTSAQEYGDALYCLLNNWAGSIVNYNHTGLCAGLDAVEYVRTFESLGKEGGGDSTSEGQFSINFYVGSSQYYGAFTSRDYSSGMPFEKRRAIVGTAKDMADEYIVYPWSAVNALEVQIGWEPVVDVSEIQKIRCDGLVEYAYEYNGVRVWRNCTYSSESWDISKYPASHNNMPDLTVEPNDELSPWAQRGATTSSATGPGYSGPPWPDTRMTLKAVVEVPVVEVDVLETTETYVDVRLRATDESGIWGFKYKLPGQTVWTTGRNPNRHPVSDTYTRDIRLTSEGELTVKAIDQGGNEASNSYDIAFSQSDGDLDDDGLPDQWEEDYFGGATNANPDATCSNGVNTVRQAYIAGFDPNNADSLFLTSIFSDRVLQWSCVSGRVYSVWWTTNLLDGFQPLETNIPWTQSCFTNPEAFPCSYYRIDVQLEE